LFYLDGNALIAVEIDDGRAALHAGGPLGGLFIMRRRPRAIAAMETKARYAVAPTETLLVHQLGEEPTVQTPITGITTWRAMLR
jgi:hypothetical protein